jgi:hypothetical protein
VTLERLRHLADIEPDLVTRTPFVYYWNEGIGPSAPWYKHLMPDVCKVSLGWTPPELTSVVSYAGAKRGASGMEQRMHLHVDHP